MAEPPPRRRLCHRVHVKVSRVLNVPMRRSLGLPCPRHWDHG
jgi:hypothetical protein